MKYPENKANIKIAKYETGKVRASSIIVSELSKEDKKKLAEEKLNKSATHD